MCRRRIKGRNIHQWTGKQKLIQHNDSRNHAVPCFSFLWAILSAQTVRSSKIRWTRVPKQRSMLRYPKTGDSRCLGSLSLASGNSPLKSSQTLRACLAFLRLFGRGDSCYGHCRSVWLVLCRSFSVRAAGVKCCFSIPDNWDFPQPLTEKKTVSFITAPLHKRQHARRLYKYYIKHMFGKLLAWVLHCFPLVSV